MIESRAKFGAYWSSALQLLHPPIDTPRSSHGALSALLISRDTRSCTIERALVVVCSVTDIIFIARHLVNLQVFVHDLLSLNNLIPRKMSIISSLS